MSIAAVNSLVDAAVAAQDAGDYATALKKLRAAEMRLAVMPDTIGVTGTQLRWDRASISRAIKQLEGTRSAAGGIRRTRINYVNPGPGEDC